MKRSKVSLSFDCSLMVDDSGFSFIDYLPADLSISTYAYSVTKTKIKLKNQLSETVQEALISTNVSRWMLG